MRIQLNTPINIEQNVKKAFANQISYKYNSLGYCDAIIAFVCPKCGAELIGDWLNWHLSTWNCSEIEKEIIAKYEKDVKNFLLEEISVIQNTKLCPLCNGELSHDKGFYLEVSNHDIIGRMDSDLKFYGLTNNTKKVKANVGFKTVPAYPIAEYKHNGKDSLFQFIKEQREESERLLANNKIDNKIALFDVPSISLEITKEKIENIKNNPEGLKEYILNLIKMEINIYSLTQRLSTLYFQYNNFIRQANAINSTPSYDNSEKLVHLDELFICFSKLARYDVGQFGIKRPFKPVEPFYKTPSLLNKKKILAENEERKEKYHADLNAYEDQLRSFEKQTNLMIAEAKDQATTLTNLLMESINETETKKVLSQNTSCISEIKSMTDNEIVEAEKLLKNLIESRNKLYSYDIVFGKYRNVVALSTFYEYLMAGRCTSLEGADGAYNLYENQIRADMIIGQLSQVIEKLDEIKDNQYMIYSELQVVNKNLEHLNKTMNEALCSIQNMENNISNISANTDIIAHNSAVTAYYSKLNAELTNSLGYMMALK